MVVIVPPNYKAAIKAGYHPEAAKEEKRGLVEYRTEDEVYRKNFPLLENMPKVQEGNVLIYDSCKSRYRNILSENTEHEMMITKAIAYKEILVALGAKGISYRVTLSEKDKENTNIEGGLSTKVAKGNGKYAKNTQLEEALKGIFESEEPNRKPFPIEHTEQLISNYGLINEDFLTTLLNRLKISREINPDDTLHGKELMKVSISKTLTDNLEIAASLSYLMFNSVSFNKHKDKIKEHFLEIELTADFGE